MVVRVQFTCHASAQTFMAAGGQSLPTSSLPSGCGTMSSSVESFVTHISPQSQDRALQALVLPQQGVLKLSGPSYDGTVNLAPTLLHRPLPTPPAPATLHEHADSASPCDARPPQFIPAPSGRSTPVAYPTAMPQQMDPTIPSQTAVEHASPQQGLQPHMATFTDSLPTVSREQLSPVRTTNPSASTC